MFKQRSNKKELLDEENIPQLDLFQNLKELHIINSLLGGYAITFKALGKIFVKNKTFTLVDIGSGGGDTLKQIHLWTKKNGFNTKLYGIDLKPDCIVYSTENEPLKDIQFICDDYRNVTSHLGKIDVIHACLFCHHLSNTEIKELICFAQKNKSVLVINDLERNPIAYYAIKFLTRVLSKSYLVKNDAPLSVLRGFKKQEWISLLNEAGAVNYSVKWRWAFRHEVIVYANNQ